MNKKEALEIMDILFTFIPNFGRNATPEFVDMWMNRLMNEGDYQQTLKKTNEYTAAKSYTPALADIIVKVHKPVKSNKQIELEEMEAAVNKEKANPELEAKRLKSIEVMQRKLRGMGAIE